MLFAKCDPPMNLPPLLQKQSLPAASGTPEGVFVQNTNIFAPLGANKTEELERMCS